MVSSANSTNQRLFVDAINQHIHNQAKQVKILCEARFPNGDIVCQSYPARVIVSSVHSFRAHPAPAHTFKPSIIIFLLQIRKGHMHCAALLNLPVFLHQLSCCTYWIRFSFALHKTKLSFTNACHLHQPSAYLPFSNLMLCIFIVIHVLSCIQATSLVFQCPSRERSSLQLNLESWMWSHWRSALSRYV